MQVHYGISSYKNIKNPVITVGTFDESDSDYVFEEDYLPVHEMKMTSPEQFEIEW